MAKPHLDSLIDVDTIYELFNENKGIEEIKEDRSLKAQVRAIFEKALKESGKSKLLIIIDELDRCQPKYAAKLLERIKHFCNLDNVIFLFGLNKSELVNMLHQEYGQNFNCTAYLNRFFDLSVSLKRIKAKTFLSQNGLEGAILADQKFAISAQIADKYNLSLRDMIQFFNQIQYATLYCGSSFEGGSNAFCLWVLFPLVLILNQQDNQQFENFINGEVCSPLLKLIDQGLEKKIENILYRTVKTPEDVDLREDLKKIYSFLFCEVIDNSTTLRIGSCEFSIWHQRWIYEDCHFLLPGI